MLLVVQVTKQHYLLLYRHNIKKLNQTLKFYTLVVMQKNLHIHIQKCLLSQFLNPCIYQCMLIVLIFKIIRKLEKITIQPLQRLPLNFYTIYPLMNICTLILAIIPKLIQMIHHLTYLIIVLTFTSK